LWPAGTLCITIAANIAETGILDYPACFPDSVVGFIADSTKADVRFVEYSFRHMRLRLQREASGTVQDNINLETLDRLRFPLPSLLEQRRIARVLGALDAKIELNRRTNETLEAMARALFRAWFVDFEPVRAKLDGRPLDPLSQKHLHLFPDRLVDAELGEIPEGWECGKWGDFATLEYGKAIKDYRTDSGRFPVYGTNGPIGFTDAALCAHPGVIVGRKGAYRGVNFCDSPFFVIDTAFYLKPKREMPPRWAYYEVLRNDINSMDSGSAIPSTSREDFYALPVVMPPLDLLRQFETILGPAWQMQASKREESNALVQTRDALLPKLLSGEVTAA